MNKMDESRPNNVALNFYLVQVIGFILFVLGKNLENTVIFSISFALFFVLLVVSTYWVIKNWRKYPELDTSSRKVFVAACKSIFLSIGFMILYWIMIVKINPRWISFP